jgi:hypothetical protein
MSDNVNVLIEKMNQESLKKRQNQKKKFGVHEGKSGGDVINQKTESDEERGTS